MRYHWLAQLINQRGFQSGVELGVATGVTTMYLLKNCPTLTYLVGIDSWEEEHVKQWWTPKNSNTEANFRKKFEKFNQLKIMKGISWDIANQFKDEAFDFIFIDASHDYESVKKDIVAWYPKIKRYGILSGHDFNLPSVKQAVVETLLYPNDTEIDNCWFYRKVQK